MALKKYLVKKESNFNKSLLLHFYEANDSAFVIEGLTFDEKRKLFNNAEIKRSGKNNEVAFDKLTTSVVIAYLDDTYTLNALVLEDKNKQYYFFRIDLQKPRVLRIQSNYISKDLKSLCDDYEKSGSRRKNYGGEGDFSMIANDDYFEKHNKELLDKHINPKSPVSRITFDSANMYFSDIARMVEQNKIHLIGVEDKRILYRDTLAKQTRNRRDVVFVNTTTQYVEYLIYSIKFNLINHYLLFKHTKDNELELILKSTVFSDLFLLTDLKDIKYKDHSLEDGRLLSNVSYSDFISAYIEFKRDQEIDELITKLEEEKVEVAPKPLISDELLQILNNFNCEIIDDLLFFKDYEEVSLAFIQGKHIFICVSRDLDNYDDFTKIHLSQVKTIENTITDLLEKKPSSRVLLLEKFISRAETRLLEYTDEQNLMIKEIEDLYKNLWDTDKKYFNSYITKLMNRFNKWRSFNKESIAKNFKNLKTANIDNVSLTIHGSDRISKRIKDLSYEEKLNLAKLAFEEGKTPMHFYDSSPNDYSCLLYIQNKTRNTTIKLYKEVVFVFSKEISHQLITCFPYKQSFDNFMRYQKQKV